MKITKHAVATIGYTLTDDEGTVIDTSEGGEPLSYLHGAGNLLPSLEQALEGKSGGDTLQVSIAPADGYGVREEALVQSVSREQFPEEVELAVGMQFQTTSELGPHTVTVMAIEGDEVTVDGNHPLAGYTLHFAVTVQDVRDATPEELDHGHVHGPGGHHH